MSGPNNEAKKPTQDLGISDSMEQSATAPRGNDRPSSEHPTRAIDLESSSQDTTPSDRDSSSREPETEKFTFLDPPEAPGELGRLAHYRILKLIGKGGMGLVFRAEDPRLNRPVAIKVMRPELAEEQTARQRFLREARSTAAVRSEYIVAIHEVGLFKDLPYLATEFLQGKPLDDCLEQDPRPTVPEIIDLGLQLARGLDAAHRSGLIHRDIKPANIWVEATTRRIKILDFGLARSTEGQDSLTQCGTILGTPAYMSPEQADGQPVDARCDLFSLGCVLYEVASGQMPFEGTSTIALLKATALKDPTPLRQLAPDLPHELADLVMLLLEKNPAKRPASAAVVASMLEALADSSFVTHARRTQRAVPLLATMQIAPPGRDRRLVKRAVAAGLLGVALLAAGAFWWFRSHGPTAPSSAGPPTATSDPTRTAAVQGVSDNEILLGMTGPYSGSARELGRSMEIGIQTYFRHVNDLGGIAGRKLKLFVLDDGYQPDRALANMKELYETHKVFGVIGNVGTPTAEKTLPYALDKGMLLLGALSGAPLLRKDPPDRFVFNYRASYTEETAAIVKYLLDIKRIRPEQVAVFAQQDGYGDAGFNGVAKMMRQQGRQPNEILRVGYPRNTNEVDPAVQEILKHDEIRAVVMVATYKPAASFIRKLKDAKRDLLFTNVSFVGSDALAEELREFGPGYATGVIVTQVVPHPDSHSSAVLAFRERLQRYYPNEQPGFVCLEGYLDAMLLVEGLRQAGHDLTTARLVEALEAIRDLDIGLGTLLRYAPSEHQASHKVWGTVLDAKGKYQILELD